MNKFDKAVKLIKSGEVVVFPTETVYGLGANALDELACQKIYKIKGRPQNNPLIVHVANIEQAYALGEFNDYAHKLSQFWPGPLTLVLSKKLSFNLAPCVTSGINTIAIRIPASDLALELIKRCQCPIAAPSANKSGYLSSTKYEHVVNAFEKQVFILEADSNCQYGLESTIIDVSGKIPVILRFGSITLDDIKSILGIKPQIADKLSQIKAPGMLLKHYAPRTKLRLNASYLNKGEIGLNFGDSKLDIEGALNLSKVGNLAEAAANMFHFLHQLDRFALFNNYKVIAVAPIPINGIGLAINDRLMRAAEE